MLMCGGDGLADVVGRRWGQAKLPFNANKSWAGSAAMFVGGWAFAFGFVALFNAWGNFQPALDVTRAGSLIALIALIATAIEALPFEDIDNLTLTVTAIALGLWWL